MQTLDYEPRRPQNLRGLILLLGLFITAIIALLLLVLVSAVQPL